jgi:hypothetical protein
MTTPLEEAEISRLRGRDGASVKVSSGFHTKKLKYYKIYSFFMSLEIEPTTIHTIKTYRIEYTPLKQDYFFKAQVGNILSVQTSLANTGNAIYITIQHSNFYDDEQSFHVRVVQDNERTYIHGFRYFGRLYLKCTPEQKLSISEETEKASTTTIPVNIFIKKTSEFPTI